MKVLMSVTLILLGILWIYCAIFVPYVMHARAMSDAMHFEAALNSWAAGKVNDGKLQPSDIEEIFPEGRSLLIGGENANQNFEEMVENIAQSCAPADWPGILSVLIGAAGVVSCFRKPAKIQAEGATEQPPPAPTQK